LPTGAVAVIHYPGGESLGPAYGKSALGQVLNDPQMQEFLRKPMQAVYRGISMATNAPRPELMQQLCHWLVAKESTLALYVADKPQIVVCVRLGADTPKARAVIADVLHGGKSVSKRTSQGNEVTIINSDQEQAIAKDVFVFASDTNLMDAALERID